MLNTECKQCHKKWHHDNAKYCSMCGKKLVDDNEFKVGDYVVEKNGNLISKIEEVRNKHFWGSYYNITGNFFEIDKCFIDTGDIERHATPEEITEYKAALNFHKHGREPFEVKEGDLIKSQSGTKTIISYPQTFSKLEFVNGNWKLLKTAEEIDEWLGVADE